MDVLFQSLHGFGSAKAKSRYSFSSNERATECREGVAGSIGMVFLDKASQMI